MKAILKLFSKIFFVIGILFFGFFCAFDHYVGHKPFCGEQWIIALSYTIFFSLTIISWHIYNLKNLGVDEFTDDSLSVRHTSNKETEMSQEELIEVLEMTEEYKIKHNEHEIILHTKMSWYSCGDKVTIRLSIPNNGKRKVRISSKPVFPLTVIDNGRNRVNIDNIESIL